MSQSPFPSADQLRDREHLLPVRVYYEDTDFTGVVYHGAYVRFFERGRTDFLRCVGVHHAELLTLHPPAAFVITRLEIDFKAPARIDDALIVRTTYERARGVRLEIAQRIERNGTLLCSAVVQAACIDLTGKPRRPPDMLKRKLAPFLAP